MLPWEPWLHRKMYSHTISTYSIPAGCQTPLCSSVCLRDVEPPGQEPHNFREAEQWLFCMNACLYSMLLLFYQLVSFSASCKGNECSELVDYKIPADNGESRIELLVILRSAKFKSLLSTAHFKLCSFTSEVTKNISDAYY